MDNFKSIRREEFDDIGIKELRFIAKTIGVPQSSNMKTDDVLGWIDAIVSLERQPAFKETKKGRPTKMDSPDDFPLRVLNMINELKARRERNLLNSENEMQSSGCVAVDIGKIGISNDYRNGGSDISKKLFPDEPDDDETAEDSDNNEKMKKQSDGDVNSDNGESAKTNVRRAYFPLDEDDCRSVQLEQAENFKSAYERSLGGMTEKDKGRLSRSEAKPVAVQENDADEDDVDEALDYSSGVPVYSSARASMYNQRSEKQTEKQTSDYVERRQGNRQDQRVQQHGQQQTSSYSNGFEGVDATEVREGIFEPCDTYGFVRVKGCDLSPLDAYISPAQIKRFRLRRGDLIKGLCRISQNKEKTVADGMLNIISINGDKPEAAYNRVNFDDLTPVYPDERIRLETANSSLKLAIRCIDVLAPIGKGQRALVVSPPKAGKTTLLKDIALSIKDNHPEIELITLLIDERPEEVTDLQRSIGGEIVYSTFDETPDHHIRAAELVLARAKRLVECGKDVVVMLDSITRLARAYNFAIESSGRTLSGGIDVGALHAPKRFFGAARNIEKGGSLTIIATALVDTGSKMDDIIYEEFKGTGNLEIHLDRRLSEKRIFPAIDLYRSGTRKEELLLTQRELEGSFAIRKLLSGATPEEATEQFLSMMVRAKTNEQLISALVDMLKYDKR